MLGISALERQRAETLFPDDIEPDLWDYLEDLSEFLPEFKQWAKKDGRILRPGVVWSLTTRIDALKQEDPQKALELSADAYRFALRVVKRQPEVPYVLGHALNTRGATLAMLGNTEGAAAAFKFAYRFLRRSGCHRVWYVDLYARQCTMHSRCREIEQARVYLNEALRIVEDTGPALQEEIALWRSRMLFLRGQFAVFDSRHKESIALFEETIRTLPLEDELFRFAAVQSSAYAYLLHGGEDDLHAAIEAADRADALFHGPGGAAQGKMTWLRAVIYARAGRTREACRFFQRARQILSGHDCLFEAAYACLDEADVYLVAGDWPKLAVLAGAMLDLTPALKGQSASTAAALDLLGTAVRNGQRDQGLIQDLIRKAESAVSRHTTR